MSEFSNYLEDELLDHVFAAATFTPQATLYLALTTTTPADTKTGSTITEPGTGGYARVALPFGTSSGGSISSNTAITFTNSATAAWAIKGIAIVDAATAGNVYAYDDGLTSASIGLSEKIQFLSGNVTVTLT